MKRYEFERAVYDPDNKLTAAQIAVLLWYAHHKNWNNDGLAWGSAASIARDTRFGTRSVQGARPVLEQLGWLVDSGERVPVMTGRPLVKYDLAVGVYRKSDKVCRTSDGGLPQNRTENPVDFADEQVREQVEEQESEQVTTTGKPVVDEDSEVRTDMETLLIDEMTSADSPSVGSRDAAQVEQNKKVADDVATWHSW